MQQRFQLEECAEVALARGAAHGALQGSSNSRPPPPGKLLQDNLGLDQTQEQVQGPAAPRWFQTRTGGLPKHYTRPGSTSDHLGDGHLPRLVLPGMLQKQAQQATFEAALQRAVRGTAGNAVLTDARQK
eukprot:COSAG01_NODE_2860_length_6960_cov_3.226094_1_plen_128_part_10